MTPARSATAANGQPLPIPDGRVVEELGTGEEYALLRLGRPLVVEGAIVGSASRRRLGRLWFPLRCSRRPSCYATFISDSIPLADGVETRSHSHPLLRRFMSYSDI